MLTQESIRSTFLPKSNELRQHWIKIGRWGQLKGTEEGRCLEEAHLGITDSVHYEIHVNMPKGIFKASKV